MCVLLQCKLFPQLATQIDHDFWQRKTDFSASVSLFFRGTLTNRGRKEKPSVTHNSTTSSGISRGGE